MVPVRRAGDRRPGRGERCRLVVVARDGGEYTAGAWTVAGESSVVDGIALLAPWQVYAVELRDAADDLLTQQRMI